MPANYLRLYVHLVWKTWDHLPLITPEIQAMVYPVMLHKAGELGCSVLAVGGVEDHVHLLVSMPATVTISEVVKHIKGASSRAVHLASPDLFFKWQGSYGAISVSPKAIPAIIRYIEGQAEHHRRNELHPEWETAEDSQEVNNDS